MTRDKATSRHRSRSVILLLAVLVSAAAGASRLWGWRSSDVNGRVSGSTGGPNLPGAAGLPDTQAPGAPAHPDSSPAWYRDVARQAGIDFTHYEGAQGQWAVFETMGGGVGLIDFDGDGWLDLYLIDSCNLPYDPTDWAHHSRLYRNTGGGSFDEVSDAAVAGDNHYGMGCAIADYDNDGFPDMHLNGIGFERLLRNNGDGTFADMSTVAGLCDTRMGTSSAFGDLDSDGNLELFKCNYVVDDPSQQCTVPLAGGRAYCGPDHYQSSRNVLYHNEGNGTFADISEPSGILVPQRSKSMALAIADLTGTGRPDIYVANDLVPCFLFRDTAGLRFQELALPLGVAMAGKGDPIAAMGVAVGDCDEDGLEDMVVSNFYLYHTVLYRNLGPSTGFQDVSALARVLSATRTTMGWAVGFMDCDNDGWLDLFQANGHVNDNMPGTAYAMPAQLFHNLGKGIFRDLGAEAGPYFRDAFVGRGAAFGDIDNDGRVDIAVNHQKRPFALLRNQLRNDNHAVQLELVGRASNRSAINACITATIGERRLVRQIIGGGSYLSASDLRLLIGLGPQSQIAELEIRWPSGHVQLVRGVQADQCLRITEGLAPRQVRRLATGAAD